MILLYIDPGTGSMLFSVLIGVAAALIYALRGLLIKMKFRMNGGKDATTDDEKHPFVIYTDSKRYWNVFRPVCEEFERRGIDVEFWTQSEDDPVFEAGYEHIHPTFIGEGNKGFMRLNLMHASVVFSTTPGLDVLQWKRSKYVDCYVHIRHAVDTALGYRMFGMDFYDSILLPGQYQVDEYRTVEKMRGLKPKEIEIVGQPYLDALHEKLEAAGSASGTDDPLILVAPSWGPSSILCRFGERFIDAVIKTGYRIAIRPHPQSFTADKEILDGLMAKYPDSERFSWNRDNDNFDILNRADLMITDFSGVIFDFTLVFDKPIIYADTSFDHSPYDSAWYEGTLWKFDVLPKLGKKLEESQFPHMKELIDGILTDEIYAAGRQEARDVAWQHRGESARLCVDFLEKKLEELKATEQL